MPCRQMPRREYLPDRDHRAEPLVRPPVAPAPGRYAGQRFAPTVCHVSITTWMHIAFNIFAWVDNLFFARRALGHPDTRIVTPQGIRYLHGSLGDTAAATSPCSSLKMVRAGASCRPSVFDLVHDVERRRARKLFKRSRINASCQGTPPLLRQHAQVPPFCWRGSIHAGRAYPPDR